MFDYSKAHKSERLSLSSPSLSNFKMATPVRNRPVMHCKPLGIEYFMYVNGLCLIFDFATENLHLATIFYHLIDKWRLKNFVNFEPCLIVMETFLPSNRRFSAVSRRFKLICAPESNRMFPCLYKPSRPSILAEITGSKAPDFSVIDAMFALTLISGFLCKRGWWYWLHCIPFSFSVHCFCLLQVDNLWSLPALFRQL